MVSEFSSGGGGGRLEEFEIITLEEKRPRPPFLVRQTTSIQRRRSSGRQERTGRGDRNGRSRIVGEARRRCSNATVAALTVYGTDRFLASLLCCFVPIKRRRSGRQERTGRGDRKGRSRSDMHGVGFPTRQWQLLRSIGTDRFFFLHVPSIGIAAFLCIAATSFKRTVMSSAFFASWHSKV